MRNGDPKSLKSIIKSVMANLDLEVKKVSLQLHISKGIDAIEMEIEDPYWLFVPGATYLLMLEEVKWGPEKIPIEFEFVHLTFEIRGENVKTLATKVGLQELPTEVTVDVAEMRERKISEIANRGLHILFDLLKLRNDLREFFKHLTKHFRKPKK